MEQTEEGDPSCHTGINAEWSLFENNDIIVIDEAYSIVGVDGQTDYFSNEAIAQMVIELEKHATDKLVIFAGYGGMDVEVKNNWAVGF